MKVRRGVQMLVLMPACNFTQIHPAVFISQHIKPNNGVAERSNKSGLQSGIRLPETHIVWKYKRSPECVFFLSFPCESAGVILTAR